jgi:hypothetical protein
LPCLFCAVLLVLVPYGSCGSCLLHFRPTCSRSCLKSRYCFAPGSSSWGELS